MKAYVEFDGTVYLEENEGQLFLPEYTPELRDELGLNILCKMHIDGDEIAFCSVDLKKMPPWPLKDDLVLEDNVDLLAKKAVIKSYPRVVVGGICIRNTDGEEKMLLVLPQRGIYRDWMLPSGFVQFGEGPAEALIREMREELGIEIKNIRLMGVTPLNLPDSYCFTVIFYRFDFEGSDLAAQNDEIAEIKWFPLDSDVVVQSDLLTAAVAFLRA